MPQLDRIIVFSQIFWLFVIFTLLYTTLTHFFLPKFLESLKARKLIVEFNILQATKLINESAAKQDLLQKVLIKNLILIKNILTNNLASTLLLKKDANTVKIDEKISFTIFNTIQYCDTQLLNSIFLHPKSLNLKFN